MKNLFKDIPESVLLKELLALPSPLSELELLQALDEISRKNKPNLNFFGGGVYPHFIPSAVKQLISRGEFYTAYTPYQAEASQGTLQAIFEYQTMICRLTGMEVTNASMYDGATAMTEGAFMACRITKKKEIVVSKAVNPMYREVLKTYAKGADLLIREIEFDLKTGQTPVPDLGENSACYIIQQPNFFGCLEEVSKLSDKVHSNGSIFITVADPISLGILKAPGDYGADIVAGEGQSLGLPQNFGGPLLGILATKEKYLRQIPGRLVSKTVDLGGKPGYTLTLQAREQHIRRERAASNICSNEALCALAACIYLLLLGKKGLKQVAELCLQKSNYLKKSLGSIFTAPTFKEFVADVKNGGIELGQFYPQLKGKRLLAVTEAYSKKALDEFIAKSHE
ncbi:glycine dehydrogenase (aminomethyl-transferring) [candidate division WOR-1 bacterium RIFOXYB2_FULL_37_13]|uniref:glycine dehydrogenase (aminomethyl-transferring) n=1 Tax=candidate division WOR-1 bacterium RIFOXYB2_FULL_37_13 TaxID=1802579 RepID=A0A1F4SKN5_UNCSA|nr:MAG: glycine dehydrogenase (aminomethyl-transferring) [candidate division WOR-1 bacterium RIFOXYB2_FULL_37_13]